MSKQYDPNRIGQDAQRLGGLHTSAGLAKLYTNLPNGIAVPTGSTAYTSDAGFVFFNGSSWIAIAGPSQATHAAVVGDSFMQQAGSGSDFTTPTLQSANVPLLNTLAYEPWYFDPVLDNFGVAGGKTADITNQLSNIIARKPGLLFIQGGHNDFLAYGPSIFNSMIVQWQNIIATVISAGIRPILILESAPNSNQSSANVTLAQLRQLVVGFNQWKRYYAQEKNILVWDWYTPTLDNTSSAGAMLAAFTDDSIHPNFAGNMAFCKSGLTQLASIIGTPNTSAVTGQSDAYDATYNPYGNLTPSPFFLSTGGSLGTGVTGTSPTGWNSSTIVSGTGKTIASSLVASSDGIGQWYQVAISGTATGAGSSQILWLSNASSFGGSLPAGTVVEGWVQVNVLASSPFNNVMAKLGVGANTGIGGGVVNPGFNNGAGPTTAWSGMIYIPPTTVPSSGYGGMTLYLQIQYNDSGNTFAGTVQFRRPTVRIVQYAY